LTNLSPAAQAVRDAFDIASIDTAIFGDPDRRLAAALRAAADQLSFQLPFEDSRCVAVLDLLAIAAELEGAND